jgi:hypothetical protein
MPGRILSLGALLAASVAGAGVALASCSSVNNQGIGVYAPPFSTEGFDPFGNFLIHRCGTLDCHGQSGRNFRVWGCDGMRLDSEQASTCTPDPAGGGATTLEEYLATYRSLVGLEPQEISVVFAGCQGQTSADGGAAYPPSASCHPEYLTFVRKARGTEAHKGGQLICIEPPCPPGVPDPDPYDPQDVCIVSWLENETERAACGESLRIPTFPLADASAP